MSDERIILSCVLFASLSLSFQLFDESWHQDEEKSMSRKGVVVIGFLFASLSLSCPVCRQRRGVANEVQFISISYYERSLS